MKSIGQTNSSAKLLAGQAGVSILHYFGRNLPRENFFFLANFIENWAPFTENSIMAIFTDPKAKKSENIPNDQYKGNVFNFKLLYKNQSHMLK